MEGICCKCWPLRQLRVNNEEEYNHSESGNIWQGWRSQPQSNVCGFFLKMYPYHLWWQMRRVSSDFQCMPCLSVVAEVKGMLIMSSIGGRWAFSYATSASCHHTIYNTLLLYSQEGNPSTLWKKTGFLAESQMKRWRGCHIYSCVLNIKWESARC